MRDQNQDFPTTSPASGGDADRQRVRARRTLVGFVAVLVVVGAAYQVVYRAGLQSTAALFVGIPAMLVVGLLFLPRSGSAIGMALKGTAIGVLIGMIVLPEGLLCWVFILPLVLIVAVTVGAAVDARRRRRIARSGEMSIPPYWRDAKALGIVAIPLFVMSLEGVAGSPFPTADRARAEVVVAATPDAVAAAVAAPPAFRSPLPRFLRIGFNQPMSATGSGLAVGDIRTVTFTGGTHDDHPLKLFGLSGHSGMHHMADMRLHVAESAPGRVVFAIDSDETMLARWATLQRAVVTWHAVDASHTLVTWTLNYDRKLAPAAYFGPLERYGLDLSARYLLTTVVAERLGQPQ